MPNRVVDIPVASPRIAINEALTTIETIFLLSPKLSLVSLII